MALSGVNSAPIPEEPKQNQLQKTEENQDDKNLALLIQTKMVLLL